MQGVIYHLIANFSSFIFKTLWWFFILFSALFLFYYSSDKKWQSSFRMGLLGIYLELCPADVVHKSSKKPGPNYEKGQRW